MSASPFATAYSDSMATNNTPLTKVNANASATPLDFTAILTSEVKSMLHAALCQQIHSDWSDNRWQKLTATSSHKFSSSWQRLTQQALNQCEYQLTEWLIQLFNVAFNKQQVCLVRGDDEPEYLPAKAGMPAQIIFAHGFFASAMHEISHWCIAGSQRRTLVDHGYWYTADGRNQAQQQAFERVEIKPQAVECLFSLACGQSFRISQDNLFADFDTSSSTFADDVYRQVAAYIQAPHTMPKDAKYLLWLLLSLCND